MRQDEREQPGQAPDGRPPHEQPRWRQDFPIDWAQDEYVARRDLVKFMVLTSLAFVVGQVSLATRRLWAGTRRDAHERVAIANVDELRVGGSKVFEYPRGSTPRLLLRVEEDRFLAYDQQCTHLQCPVLPVLAQGKLHCPCHNGWFDAETGRPLAGPPRRPLPRVLLEVSGGQVFAVGVADGHT